MTLIKPPDRKCTRCDNASPMRISENTHFERKTIGALPFVASCSEYGSFYECAAGRKDGKA